MTDHTLTPDERAHPQSHIFVADALTASEERVRELEAALRRILAEGENWGGSESMRLSHIRIWAREALK